MTSSVALITTFLIALSGTGVVVKAQYRYVPSYDCHKKNNGTKEIGCWGWVECIDGQKSQLICSFPDVYSRADNRCVRPGTGFTACGIYTSCAYMTDGLYADVGFQCESFFTCHEGNFVGRQYCPEGLSFNEKKQSCDYVGTFPCK